MKKLALFTFAAGAVLFFAGSAKAQDDYNRWEVFGGYSHSRIDTDVPDNIGIDNDTAPIDDDFFLDEIIQDRVGAHGFEFAFTGNATRYIGAKASVTGHFLNDEVSQGNFRSDMDTSLWNILVGLQVKDNTDDDDHRFKPFGHALVGSAIARNEFTVGPGFRNFEFTETGFAAAFGGGIDIRAGDNIDIRLFQVDYNPTWLFDRTQHNFRIGVGIVFH